MAGAGLAAAMVVLGPATALVVDAKRFAATGHAPVFLAVQFADILAFAGLTAAGLLMREVPSAHKRLMLLGLIYISDAGFARYLNDFMASPFGHGFWGEAAGLYLGSDLLMIGLGVYDLATRGVAAPRVYLRRSLGDCFPRHGFGTAGQPNLEDSVVAPDRPLRLFEKVPYLPVPGK